MHEPEEEGSPGHDVTETTSRRDYKARLVARGFTVVEEELEKLPPPDVPEVRALLGSTVWTAPSTGVDIVGAYLQVPAPATAPSSSSSSPTRGLRNRPGGCFKPQSRGRLPSLFDVYVDVRFCENGSLENSTDAVVGNLEYV